jgi:hypothetical protein
VIGIARQIMDLDDRLEDVESALKAVLEKLDAAEPARTPAPRAGRHRERKRSDPGAKGDA